MRRADIEVYAEGFVFPGAPTWHDAARWISDVVAGGPTGADTNDHPQGEAMRSQTATASVVTSATPEAIWSLVADLSTWTAWAPFESATLERQGHPDPNGVGAIRRFRRGRFTTVEEITEFVPNQRLAYRLLRGLPLRDYQATIDIRPRDGQTHITWSSTFSSRIPGMGGAFRRGMAKIYADYANLLAGAAERRPATEPQPGATR